jgi:hypothetical protein
MDRWNSLGKDSLYNGLIVYDIKTYINDVKKIPQLMIYQERYFQLLAN